MSTLPDTVSVSRPDGSTTVITGCSVQHEPRLMIVKGEDMRRTRQIVVGDQIDVQEHPKGTVTYVEYEDESDMYGITVEFDSI
ncbi:hypothetical protein [Nocardia africana]